MKQAAPTSLAVIISTYNSPAYLAMTLEGYACQSDQKFSIYIADDGSGPEIAAVIDAFSKRHAIRIRHLWHEDKGYRRALALNRAISAVEEPYIVLTDADCVPFSGMVAAHKSIAENGMFIRGSRILLSEKITCRLSATKGWRPDMSAWQWVLWRLQGHVNRLFPLLLPITTSRPDEKLPGIRGCHFAFWAKDIVHINGFDSSYEGWGREDSDLAARLFHAGVRRRNLYGMPVLHLWHKEASRDRLNENDDMLRQCLEEKRIRALRGLDAVARP